GHLHVELPGLRQCGALQHPADERHVEGPARPDRLGVAAHPATEVPQPQLVLVDVFGALGEQHDGRHEDQDALDPVANVVPDLVDEGHTGQHRSITSLTRPLLRGFVKTDKAAWPDCEWRGPEFLYP